MLFDDISYLELWWAFQGSKIVLVRSYLRVSQAARQVNIFIFLLKIKFSPYMPINFVMQGKCLFSDISRPAFWSAERNNLCNFGSGYPEEQFCELIIWTCGSGRDVV